MSPISDLLAQKAEIEKKIAEAQKIEKAQAIANIKEMMDQYNVSLADLSPRGLVPRKPRSTKGMKIPPKYMDPVSGKTWSGRGVTPNWLSELMEKTGKSIEDFAIKG